MSTARLPPKGQITIAVDVHRSLAMLLFTVMCLLTGPAQGADMTASPVPPALEVYVRDGCPHCADAKVFLEQLARERPTRRIVLRPVNADPAAAAELTERSRAAGL